MIDKSCFEYYEILKYWMYLSYSLTDEQYNKANYQSLSRLINSLENDTKYFETLSQKAILNHAKEINFFTDEEYNDLVFEYIDTVFEFNNEEIESFTRCYSVSEDEETTKIFWKDVYGVWKVTFKDREIINTIRDHS